MREQLIREAVLGVELLARLRGTDSEHLAKRVQDYALDQLETAELAEVVRRLRAAEEAARVEALAHAARPVLWGPCERCMGEMLLWGGPWAQGLFLWFLWFWRLSGTIPEKFLDLTPLQLQWVLRIRIE